MLGFADLGELAKSVASHKDIKPLIDDAKNAYLASKGMNAVKVVEDIAAEKLESKQAQKEIV